MPSLIQLVVPVLSFFCDGGKTEFCCLAMWMRWSKNGEKCFTQADSDRTRWTGFKLKEWRFMLDVRRNSSLRGWWGSGTGCLEKLRMPHPWMCSRPGWMGLWVTWSDGMFPAHGRNVGPLQHKPFYDPPISWSGWAPLTTAGLPSRLPGTTSLVSKALATLDLSVSLSYAPQQ